MRDRCVRGLGACAGQVVLNYWDDKQKGLLMGKPFIIFKLQYTFRHEPERIEKTKVEALDKLYPTGAKCQLLFRFSLSLCKTYGLSKSQVQ